MTGLYTILVSVKSPFSVFAIRLTVKVERDACSYMSIGLRGETFSLCVVFRRDNDV